MFICLFTWSISRPRIVWANDSLTIGTTRCGRSKNVTVEPTIDSRSNYTWDGKFALTEQKQWTTIYLCMYITIVESRIFFVWWKVCPKTLLLIFKSLDLSIYLSIFNIAIIQMEFSNNLVRNATTSRFFFSSVNPMAWKSIPWNNAVDRTISSYLVFCKELFHDW